MATGIKTNINDYIGKRYNKLTIIGNGGKAKDGHTKVQCRCDCGNVKNILLKSILSGRSTSCGCRSRILSSERRLKHGCTANYHVERLFRVWATMKDRCNNPKCKTYRHYGGRGISVCEEWNKDYLAFRTWAFQNGYDENAKRGECTLDRIDVDGDYCPNNCRWVDIGFQQNNKRNNLYIECNGETHTIREWSNITGVSYKALYRKLRVRKLAPELVLGDYRKE